MQQAGPLLNSVLLWSASISAQGSSRACWGTVDTAHRLQRQYKAAGNLPLPTCLLPVLCLGLLLFSVFDVWEALLALHWKVSTSTM